MYNKTKLNFNKYDYCNIGVISLLFFGNIGGAFQPIRIVALLLFPYILIWILQNKFTKPQMLIINFFTFWYLYAIISLFWTVDKTEAYKELFYYFVHFSLFLIIILFAQKSNKPLQSIIYGWCLFFIITVPIALNEIINDQHLPSSIFASDNLVNLSEGTIVQKKFASVTFGNYNAYVTILAFALPFLFANLFLSKRIIHQIVGLILVATCTFIFLINASRGGVICLLITVAVFLFYYRKENFKFKRGLITLALLILFIAFYFYSSTIFQQLSYRYISTDSFFEDKTRSNLIQIAIQFIHDTYFVGTGIGSMVSSLSAVSYGGISILHNLFLEIFMQYGLIIFIIVILYFYKLYIIARKIQSTKIKFIVYTILLLLIPSSVINSGYLLMPSLWVFWASIFVTVTNKKIMRDETRHLVIY
jgi:teichuronic acid biosynthesis protein TuaE